MPLNEQRKKEKRFVKQEDDSDTSHSGSTLNNPKSLEKRLREQKILRRIESVQIIALEKVARIFRSILER